jgi:tetratricopeptide (TPR) repeat protein
MDLNNYQIAKNLYTKALNIKELHYGYEHPQTAIALTNLGNIYMDLGNSEIATDFFTKALKQTDYMMDKNIHKLLLH